MEAATSNIIAESLPFTSNFNSYDNTYSEFYTSSYSFDSMLRFDLKNYVNNYSWGSIRGSDRSAFYDTFTKSGYQLHHYYGHEIKKRLHEENKGIWQKDQYPFIHKY